MQGMYGWFKCKAIQYHLNKDHGTISRGYSKFEYFLWWDFDMTSPQIGHFLVWISGGNTLYMLPKYSLLSPDQLASKAPWSSWKKFDSSGRISRVVAEVRPHKNRLLLHPFLGSLWPKTIVSRCDCVCIVYWAMSISMTR